MMYNRFAKNEDLKYFDTSNNKIVTNGIVTSGKLAVNRDLMMVSAGDAYCYIVPVCALLNYNLQMNYDYYDEMGQQWDSIPTNFNVRYPKDIDGLEVDFQNQDFKSWAFKYDAGTAIDGVSIDIDTVNQKIKLSPRV